MRTTPRHTKGGVAINESHRTLTLVGGAIVALATIVVSSVHLYEVATVANAGWLAFLTPVAVDGLGLTAAVSLWASRRQGRDAKPSAIVAIVLSLLASISGNVLWPFLTDLTPGAVRALSAVVAVVPALALAVSVELVLDAVADGASTKPLGESATQTAPLDADDQGVTVPPELPSDGNADPLELLRRELARRPDATSAELAAVVGRSDSWCRAKRKLIKSE